jgi:hypothetical protein
MLYNYGFIKFTVCWDMTPYTPMDCYRLVGRTHSLHFPKDGGRTFLRNVSNHLPDYMVSVPEDSNIHKQRRDTHEEDHSIGWDDIWILEIGSINRCRKYKESAHVACLTNPISQPSLDISPIWFPVISNEVSNSQRRSVWRNRFFMGFQKILASNVQVLLHKWR